MRPLIAVGLASLAYGAVVALLTKATAEATRMPRGLGRKIFHIGIFTGAVPVQLLAGFWGVVLYGSISALLVLVGTGAGTGGGLSRALARDAEREVTEASILTPLSSTALGGLTGALLVGDFAIVGYLVCGWGDALGGLVGRHWGRRTYLPRLGWMDPDRRSVEGSIAVFLGGLLGASVALILLGCGTWEVVLGGVACGLAGSVAEAASPADTDNFWCQVIPALVGWWLLG